MENNNQKEDNVSTLSCTNNEKKINQIYIEILCNLIRRQNISLLEKIGEIECIPIQNLLSKYIISKSRMKNILAEHLNK
tara:strand:+ start:208 stop:444 length:237 start_codon:yes stop_codon:yes gene_type:complete